MFTWRLLEELGTLLTFAIQTSSVTRWMNAKLLEEFDRVIEFKFRHVVRYMGQNGELRFTPFFGSQIPP